MGKKESSWLLYLVFLVSCDCYYDSSLQCLGLVCNVWLWYFREQTHLLFQHVSIKYSSLSSYNKTCLKRPLSKIPPMGFQDQLLLNAGQKYCRLLQGEHSAIISTCIELPQGFKTFVLSILEWLLKTGFTVSKKIQYSKNQQNLRRRFGTSLS